MHRFLFSFRACYVKTKNSHFEIPFHFFKTILVLCIGFCLAASMANRKSRRSFRSDSGTKQCNHKSKYTYISKMRKDTISRWQDRILMLIFGMTGVIFLHTHTHTIYVQGSYYIQLHIICFDVRCRITNSKMVLRMWEILSIQAIVLQSELRTIFGILHALTEVRIEVTASKKMGFMARPHRIWHLRLTILSIDSFWQNFKWQMTKKKKSSEFLTIRPKKKRNRIKKSTKKKKTTKKWSKIMATNFNSSNKRRNYIQKSGKP